MTVAVPCCVQSTRYRTRDQQTASWVAASSCFSLDASSEQDNQDSEQSPVRDSSGSPPDDATAYYYLHEIRKLQKTNTEVVQELFKQRAAAEQAQRDAAEQARVAAEQAQRIVELEQKLHESAVYRQTALALQASSPEAALLWRAQNDALIARDQELSKLKTVAERQSKKIRAQARKMTRNGQMAKRDLPPSFVKVARQKLGGFREDGFCDYISHAIIANVQLPDTDKKQKQWRKSKIASEHVFLKIPGSSMSREGEDGWIGGIVTNPRRLLPMMVMWCAKNLSIRVVANMAAQEFGLAQDALYVSAVRHKGAAVTKRKSFPGSKEKPLEVLGSFGESTVADGIHGFLNALDRYVSKRILTADGIHISLDISTFGYAHMQSLYLAAWRVLTKGFDPGNNPLPYVERIEGFAPAVAVGDKLTRQFVDVDGNLFSTATVRAAATSLMLANLLEVILHGCVSCGVDGGGEGGGSGGGSNKNGSGSYRRGLFGDRTGFDQAMEKDGPFLNNLMDLYGVTEEVRLLTQRRDQPRTLEPVTTYTTCEKKLVHRDGRVETLPPRPSMTNDPMGCMAMVLGGVPLVFGCLKHLGHCAALHSNKLTLPHARDMASTILAIDNVWIFTRLKAVLGAVFGLEGCGPATKLQAAVGARLKELNPILFKSVQLRYKSVAGFTKFTEACGTRWGAIGEGAMESDDRIPEVSVCVILTFSSGLDINRENAAVSVWSKDGFCHNGLIQFSPKLGNLVFKLNDPGYVFGTAMQAFFHKMAHAVLLSKSSHLKESSSLAMGGVASVPKRVLFFLSRLMWLVVPLPKNPKAAQVLKAVEKWKALPGVLYKGKGGRNDRQWEMHYILQYKGPVGAKPGRGLLMLNPKVARKPACGGNSPVKNLFADAYHQGMEGAIDRLCEVINRTSQLRLDDNRNYLPKGIIRTLCNGPQDNPRQRVARLLEAVAYTAANTFKSVYEQYKSTMNDPHMYLAGTCAVDAVPVVSMDGKGKSTYYVASDVALANATCFEAQMQEIEKGYASKLTEGESLSEFLHGPLKQFCRDPTVQKELKDFQRARDVQLSSKWTEAPGYGRGADSTKCNYTFRPKPVSAYSELSKLAYLCTAQPRTNQRVEGGFSHASIAFRCNRRHQGPEMWSETIRKKNPFTLGVGEDSLRGEEFIATFAESLAFRRKNRDGFRSCYAPCTSETERKYDSKMHADMPQYVKNGSAYAETNISDASAKEKVLQARDRNGGAKQNSRHRGCCDDDDDADEMTKADRDVAPRLGRQRGPLTAANPPASRWTLAALNKEKVEDLRDICLSQDLVVSPSHGKRCVKADYVAAILNDQDSRHDQSDTQLDENNDLGDEACGDDACEGAQTVLVDSNPAEFSSGISLIASCVPKDLAPCAIDSQAIGTQQPDRECGLISESPVHSVQSLPVMSFDAATGPATAATTDCDSPQQELMSELDSFFRDCEENDIDPFGYDGEEVNSRELEMFDRDMNASVAGSELLPLDPEPNQEDAVMGIKTTPIEAIEALAALKAKGVWKRKYAEALAASRDWKPSVIVDKKSSSRGRNPRNMGAPLRSVTLSRFDGKQFTVAATGCVFFLLNTPRGVELVKICEIFHPVGDENEQKQVLVEYHRVMRGSLVADICDRVDNLTNVVQGSDGKPVICTSAGSKEIRRQIEERKGKEELYHWGDVSFIANAENLLGAVYWITVAYERDRILDAEFRKTLLTGIKDKFPITDLKSMDYVVVGSSFSDIKS